MHSKCLLKQAYAPLFDSFHLERIQLTVLARNRNQLALRRLRGLPWGFLKEFPFDFVCVDFHLAPSIPFIYEQ